MLSPSDRKKLDRIFTALQQFQQRGWACAAEGDFWQNGVVFIRRGPLLLFGRWRFGGILVVDPFHGAIQEVIVKDNELQIVEARGAEGVTAIQVYEEDEGPWWEFLQHEIEPLEKWIKEVRQANDRKSQRDLALKRAAASVRTVLNFARNPLV